MMIEEWGPSFISFLIDYAEPPSRGVVALDCMRPSPSIACAMPFGLIL